MTTCGNNVSPCSYCTSSKESFQCKNWKSDCVLMKLCRYHITVELLSSFLNQWPSMNWSKCMGTWCLWENLLRNSRILYVHLLDIVWWPTCFKSRTDTTRILWSEEMGLLFTLILGSSWATCLVRVWSFRKKSPSSSLINTLKHWEV